MTDPSFIQARVREACWKLAPALCCGNAMVSSLALAALLCEAGLGLLLACAGPSTTTHTPDEPAGNTAAPAVSEDVEPDAPAESDESDMTIESESVPGALDGQSIRRVVRQHIGAIRACYELEDGEPQLFAIEFTIGPSGAVEHVDLTPAESLEYPKVPRCIADEIQQWTFPPPAGGGYVVVSYPLH